MLQCVAMSDLQIVKYMSNAMYYTMLYMLECMRKGKHRIRTPRTRGLHGSALSTYIHEENPLRATSLLSKSIVQ